VGSLDGLAYIWVGGAGGDGQDTIRLTSPEMDKPLEIRKDAAETPLRIRFDRLPSAPPPDPALERFVAPAPPQTAAEIEPLAPGQVVPDLHVERWLSGAPVSLATLAGKVVVIAINGASPGARARRLITDSGGRAVALQLVSPNTGGTTPDPLFLAVGEDPAIARSSSGENALRLGAGYGLVLIAPDGRLAAVGLNEPFLSAKLEQLIANAGAAGQ
jgi:hypothetical protein